MLVFPQLETGSSALYPMMRKNVTRTVTNVLDDGRMVISSDPDAVTHAWEFQAAGLTLNEWTAIDTLFQATSGRFATFTFLDPAGNLLCRSEELGDPAWSVSPLIQLTAGIGDPLGSSRATRAANAAPAPGTIGQTLAVPGNFLYTLSVWAKTTGGSNVSLSASTIGGNVSQNFVLTSEWRRASLQVELGMHTESLDFGVGLEAGASVDLFGMQVEAQRGASDYKRTGSLGGVHALARFAEDDLTVTAKGTDLFDAVIRIVAS